MEKVAQQEFEQHLETFDEVLLPEDHPYYDRVAKVAARILNSNTISIIKYGNGFKYLGLASTLCIIVTYFDIKTISLVHKLINSISNINNSYKFFSRSTLVLEIIVIDF